MPEDAKTPNGPPADASAQPNAGTNAPPQPPAADEPPVWAKQLIQQTSELRKGITTLGQKQKAYEQQLQQQQYQAQQYAPQGYGDYGVGNDPFADSESVGSLTPAQLRQQMAAIAEEKARAYAEATIGAYGLDSWKRSQAVQDANSYALSEGLPALSPDMIQQYGRKATEIIEQFGGQATPQTAYMAIKMAAAEAQSGQTQAAAEQRAQQTAQTNETSAAIPTQTGSAASPPPPEGSTPKRPIDAVRDEIMTKVINPWIEEPESA